MSEGSRPDSKPMYCGADAEVRTSDAGVGLPIQALIRLAASSGGAPNPDLRAWHGTFSNLRESHGLVD